VPFLPSLYFPRSAFDSAAAGGATAADDAIGRMVEAAARLEQLVIYCPFSSTHLPRWLALRSASLRVLELRVDSAADKAAASDAGSGHLDCIGLVSTLQELRLWGLTMTRAPAWGQLARLRVLEIVGAHLEDLAVCGAVHACPSLTDLALLGCECAGAVNFTLPLLQRCRLDFVGSGTCALTLAAPHVESLEVQGFNWIVLQGGDRLKRLTIAKNTGTHALQTPIHHYSYPARQFPSGLILFTVNRFFQGACLPCGSRSSRCWTTCRCAACSGAGEPSATCCSAPPRSGIWS
jgi:hypothetical protein